MDDHTLPRYRLLQLGAPDPNGVQRNVGFDNLEDLVTHHPGANRRARLVGGVPTGVENARRRSYGVIGGEIQEIETARTDEYRTLKQDQVLLVKDFILEDARIASGGTGVRDVDVPSPVAGHVGRVDLANGVVEVLDRKDGDVILRARHLDPISVAVGDSVVYGQSLGVQNRAGLPASAGKHVHFEVDTRYYNLFERYVRDLSDGTLTMDASRRWEGIASPVAADDGVIRIGERDPRVRDVQAALNEAGHADANGMPWPCDDVYRLSMQPALIRFQQARWLPVTGDIDAPTLNLVMVRRREADRLDHMLPGRAPCATMPLLEEARKRVGGLDARLGKPYDEASERMAASLAVLAKEHGFDRIDHVVLSIATNDAAAGRAVFIFQGDPRDPTHLRAAMPTDVAVRTPAARSLDRLQELDRASAQARGEKPLSLANGMEHEVQRRTLAGI